MLYGEERGIYGESTMSMDIVISGAIMLVYFIITVETMNCIQPYYNGEVDYGDRAEHCWNGDHSRPNATSRLRYHQMFIKKAVERIEISAPEGADLKSWRY